MTDDTKQHVRLARTESGDHFVTMDTVEYEETYVGRQPVSQSREGQWAFVDLKREGIADVVRGDIPSLEGDGRPVIYVGNNLGKHYWREDDLGKIPPAVAQKLAEAGLSLVTGTDAGWENWDGRPEWSETYIDVTQAEVVDVESRWNLG